MGPRLNRGSLIVSDRNPASLINTILYGPEMHTTGEASSWRKPMQDFQYQLDDEEIAAVASFIRQSWDNQAPAVTPEQVARQR
jgi:mono/diheme cytochrome c family protein